MEEERLRNAIMRKVMKLEKCLDGINLKTGYGFEITIETKKKEKTCKVTTARIWAHKLDE